MQKTVVEMCVAVMMTRPLFFYFFIIISWQYTRALLLLLPRARASHPFFCVCVGS